MEEPIILIHFSSLGEDDNMDTLYPGFRYIETGDTVDPSDREDREAGEEALWRRSSVPLLPGWAADHRSDQIQISFVYWNMHKFGNTIY